MTVIAAAPQATDGAMIHCTQCGGIVMCNQSQIRIDDKLGHIYVCRGFCKKCRAIFEVTQRVIGKANWYEPPAPMGAH
jgi:hypothetical protein